VAGFVAWFLAGLVLTALLASAIFRWRHDGRMPWRLRAADWLTLSRFALIAPTVWLVAHDQFLAGAACYLVLGATDVADGIIARRRGETSAFGVILDPLADILSTFAVFSALVFAGLVPLWLYLLLILRYVSLGVGALVLSRRWGPIAYHATLPGKIVGVVQAAGVLLILVATGLGVSWQPLSGPLFAFLGLGFVSIVISQAIIGYRHVARAVRRAKGWHRGSSR
jgi:phosphatidylglycerophosphate synthase